MKSRITEKYSMTNGEDSWRVSKCALVRCIALLMVVVQRHPIGTKFSFERWSRSWLSQYNFTSPTCPSTSSLADNPEYDQNLFNANMHSLRERDFLAGKVETETTSQVSQWTLFLCMCHLSVSPIVFIPVYSCGVPADTPVFRASLSKYRTCDISSIRPSGERGKATEAAINTLDAWGVNM